MRQRQRRFTPKVSLGIEDVHSVKFKPLSINHDRIKKKKESRKKNYSPEKAIKVSLSFFLLSQSVQVGPKINLKQLICKIFCCDKIQTNVVISKSSSTF